MRNQRLSVALGAPVLWAWITGAAVVSAGAGAGLQATATAAPRVPRAKTNNCRVIVSSYDDGLVGLSSGRFLAVVLSNFRAQTRRRRQRR